MPRIGLVCEGGTDRAAIERYVGRSLVSRGYSDVTFLEIPATVNRDNTLPIHGWAMVLAWLNRIPGERNLYLSDMFERDRSEKCDAIVIHLDADNLSDLQFREHVAKHYGATVQDPDTPRHRGKEITRIIRLVGKLDTSPDQSTKRYVVAAAVEATETWRVSAFRVVSGDPERLSGLDLCQRFMTALHKVERRPMRPFRNVSKDVSRRKRFCRSTADYASRIESQCYHYKRLITDLCEVV